jgi:beta-aspartyl-peptidase (threonine type)
MKISWLAVIVCLFTACTSQETKHTHTEEMKGKYAIAIHGGAGNLVKMNLTAEEQKAYKQALDSALTAGSNLLAAGGTSVEAVEAAIRVLEDCPLFNAGKGAVFTHDGHNELDAAIMNGSNLECGAVASVRHIKNPISAARKVMEHSEFILLNSEGAESFAKEQGVELVDTSYFFTQHGWDQLQDAIEDDKTELDHSGKQKASTEQKPREEKFGTVGCVALDIHGNIAAGTSTGGLTNKRYGRIGDSPLIGSGTYADNATCAVSCTGKGEDFIRLNVAHDIASMIRYTDAELKAACDSVVLKKLKDIKGRGGCIAIDCQGNIAMPFTTTGMFRGSVDINGVKKIALYSEEKP